MLRPNKLHKMQYYYPPKIPEYTNDAITFFTRLIKTTERNALP